MNDDGRHIVLVVDDAENVGLLIDVRLNLDYPDAFYVRTVSSNFDGLLEGSEPWAGVDLLVLDLSLGPLGLEDDLYATARRIFTFGREQHPTLPIVVFSAVVGLRHSPDLEQMADKVILKPNLSEVVDTIARILGVSGAAK